LSATVVACGPGCTVGGDQPHREASASASAGPTKGGVLRIGYGAEVDNLNAFTSQFLTDIELTMVEGLIVSNDKNEYIPVLAKQVRRSRTAWSRRGRTGKLELTWPCKQGVMWHDQVHEFTAEDVCFTWKYVVSIGSEVYNRNSYFRSATAACRTSTRRYGLDKPSAIYNGLFEAILPKYMLDGKDIVKYDDTTGAPSEPGRSSSSEWKAGEYVRVKRNPNYWRGPKVPVRRRGRLPLQSPTSTRDSTR